MFCRGCLGPCGRRNTLIRAYGMKEGFEKRFHMSKATIPSWLGLPMRQRGVRHERAVREEARGVPSLRSGGDTGTASPIASQSLRSLLTIRFAVGFELATRSQSRRGPRSSFLTKRWGHRFSAVCLQSGSQLAYNPVRSWLPIRPQLASHPVRSWLPIRPQLAYNPVRSWQLAKFVIAYFFLTNPNP